MNIKILIIMVLFITMINGQAPTFTDAGEIKANNATISEMRQPNPCIADWNEDGKKDLLFGEKRNGAIRFYENIGTDKKPVLKSSTFVKAGGVNIKLPES